MSDTTENMGAESANADPNFQTDFELGQDNIRPFGLDIHNPVFVISAVLITAFVVVSLTNQEAAASFFGWLRPWLTSTFDWFLVLSVNAMLIFCLALIV
ncbi:MAG: BCCT family transporter, partial [Pseudomonadota bacterium]